MERFVTGCLCLLLLFMLSSCTKVPTETTAVQVCILDAEGLTVENNGQWIAPGSDVVFELTLDPEHVIRSIDCSADYTLTLGGNHPRLTARSVHYPTRITIETAPAETPEEAAARYYRSITYMPQNGMDAHTETYSILTHPRPNVDQGRALSRDGYTLTGWNTQPDGSGLSVGLGSRVSVPAEGLTLYAQWAEWTDAGCFTYEVQGSGIRITGYTGTTDALVVPALIDGLPVMVLAENAFRNCAALQVILPNTLTTIEDNVFAGSAMHTLTLSDNIETISDAAFTDCFEMQTLHINAAEDPYGYQFRRESVFADKIDLLITAQGSRKLAFYGGCSMWYNLIGSEATHAFPGWQIVNLGLNGTVNSYVQMTIIGHFLEPGDVLIHTPELSSSFQRLDEQRMTMYDGDDKLWCGLEYNYDLLALVDLRQLHGVFDSWQVYLDEKKPGGNYTDMYRDTSGVSYFDETGSIPFIRTQGRTELSDSVALDPAQLADGLPNLHAMYDWYQELGAKVYVSWACVDLDGVPEDERSNVQLMDDLFHQTIAAMDGPVLISHLSDYLYTSRDFYDTHYHLLTQHAYKNTEKWLRDLKTQMQLDGLTE